MGRKLLTRIFVTLQFEAVHKWAAAAEKCPESGFLVNLHRHMFCIRAEKKVNHDDRDVEFIKFKREILGYLAAFEVDETYGCINLNNTSCEMLAKDLHRHFDLHSCEVSEDGENGAIVEWGGVE